MSNYKGASRQHEVPSSRRRKDTRSTWKILTQALDQGDGVILTLILLPFVAFFMRNLPLSGELILLFMWVLNRTYIRTEGRSFDFPYRVPGLAKVRDGSTTGGKGIGKGVTYIGNDTETQEQIYAGDSDLRTHMLVLGTTGSGKTEFLLGLVMNALVQNTGFIYVDGKGDPKLQKEIFRMARWLGREDDLLIINFITSGRDFVEKQHDKVTNNMNMMGNTSSGMLIELIVALMDDSGGGGDMWKGRAISFVAALTRPLTYMRDKGYINLSPEKYLDYFELPALEELVFEHEGKYGPMFDVIVAPLRSYLMTLPGYQESKRKKQETKTLEQHGFIVMQLTRIFNDLTFNYGHIFKTKVGDVDFFDIVINRRLLTVLLPALERAPDSMRMLGKMIVGSIKQMMAGCLGNRVEGVVREIIDSRPTNAAFPFYTILDEYGYYAVIGFAVAPAQARSLGFSVIFAAQDFSSLKKSSAEEADATWENTNIRAVGRITSGQKSETWERIQGASGEAIEAVMGGFSREVGALSEKFYQQDNVNIERRARLDYDDLAKQADGEFTFLIGKKHNKGRDGGVAVIRGMGFYTAGPAPKEMRINDFLPIESPEPNELPQVKAAMEAFLKGMLSGNFPAILNSRLQDDPVLSNMHALFNYNHARERLILSRADMAGASLGWFLLGAELPGAIRASGGSTAGGLLAKPTEPSVSAADSAFDPGAQGRRSATAALFKVSAQLVAPPVSRAASQAPAVESAVLAEPESSEEITTGTTADDFVEPPDYAYQEPPQREAAQDEVIMAGVEPTSLIINAKDTQAFRDKALPLLRHHLLRMQDDRSDPEIMESLEIADRDSLLSTDLLARGKAYSTYEEKWGAEDKADTLIAKIDDQTRYLDDPQPTPRSYDENRQQIVSFGAECHERMKDKFKG